MSAPTVEVFVEFQTLAEADLTSMVKSISVSRGRSRQLDQFNAGTATIVFHNASRELDPLNSDGAYYPYVLPRAGIRIEANGTPIFTGLVVDWDLDYDLSNNDEIVAICSDDFTVLANQSFLDWEPVEQFSGARVTEALDRPEVDYQGTRDIGFGSSNLGGYPVSQGSNVLNYLQQVNRSEQGFLFMTADGVLTFKGRTEILNLSPDFTFINDGTGVEYQSLSNEFGDEFLYNYILTEIPDVAQFVLTDTTSQAAYQTQQFSITDLLYAFEGEAEALGSFLLDKFKDPELRLTGLSKQLNGASTAHQNLCCGVDLADVVAVTKAFAVGSPSSVTQTVVVSGVNHQVVPGSHVVSYVFEPYTADSTAYLLINSSTIGIVGTNILAF
jgi:hypothetical protein